jgi:hypothetical protein
MGGEGAKKGPIRRFGVTAKTQPIQGERPRVNNMDASNSVAFNIRVKANARGSATSTSVLKRYLVQLGDVRLYPRG